MTKNRMFPLILLWHLRYGHLPFSSLNILQKKFMVKGLPMIAIQNNTCESCILGKHQRDSFPHATTYRANEPLELLHTYLCGPMQEQSLEGNFYFLTFIDDFSRKTLVYFLKN